MAKAKKKTDAPSKPAGKMTEESLLASIVKSVQGAELLDEQSILQQGFINTTNLALNYICSGRFVDGGIPKGRITQIYGPSSSAKTVLGTHILQGCQQQGGIATLVDSESAYSPSFASSLGINTQKLVYAQPDHLEGSFKFIEEVALKVADSGLDRPVAVVYDSIAASPSEREFNDMMEGKASGHEMGERARICSRELRKISSFLNRQNCALVVINQIRMKIGVMYGNPETTAGGGNSLEYYCSLMLDCRKRGVIVDSRKRPIGIEIAVKCSKNKMFAPFGVADKIRLYWDKGVDPCSGLLEVLLRADKIEKGSPGWYHLSTDKDKKFQARKDDNYVPKEFLLENPSVVDSTREELEAFLGWNSTALETAATADTEHDEDTDEDEDFSDE